ncbi:MAG: sortase family protein [uncultured bacterium]|uniref:Sortase n=3 Tax=Candidatus Daviesiibacteriota TaxID=1752718 RepID=A0A0G0I2D5_9BACT|nr:MAG: sortase family protein [uncultured bacterium]KKQ10266.1 MAG: sortase [Candidatus Daviesbacteria bacterium GW2011_GWB1_36_5]KKQ16365.1 MAG: sortase [Candidatus Daviesbacteria bacterium GW2011_GWA1_36_8]OGE16381.1 MAG: hypothetical protein A2858_04225 [Candidatus Daviesbacteria bacterium RIFCSPHIGHO2_01_FULL_36_37]OGE32329.1 MAG: hypothetical protein A3C99_02275 [Candidatus Daviesbacteria bacterium RIFCSPHIGHO2_02_FULL_37_9]
MKKRPWNYYAGNGLIIFGLLLLLTIYLPIIKLFLPLPHAAADFSDTNNTILIPKINAYAPVIKEVDAFNEAEYRAALKKGVAQAKGIPNFYFAHSSDSPWNLTSYNTVFLRLGELKNGDEIVIKDEGVEKKYKVVDKKIVWPSDVKAVTQLSGDKLILQTCTPIGTSLKRLLIFAEPV